MLVGHVVWPDARAASCHGSGSSHLFVVAKRARQRIEANAPRPPRFPSDIRPGAPFSRHQLSSSLCREEACPSMADSLKVNGAGRPANIKHPSAPSLMMNAHFASVGEDASREEYEHGIQVIDEDKLFK